MGPLWKLAWNFPGNQQITSLWNGDYTQCPQYCARLTVTEGCRNFSKLSPDYAGLWLACSASIIGSW